MLRFLKSFRTKIKEWQDRRFLKRHHVETWAAYNRHYDPDVNKRSSRISDFYHGYAHWFVFENNNHYFYKVLPVNGWRDVRYGYKDAERWCEQNCTDKFRFDMHRVINESVTDYQWVINDIGGGDHMVVAFKSESDFMMFMLKWA